MTRRTAPISSKEWTCPACKTCNSDILPDPSPATAPPPSNTLVNLLTPGSDLPPSEDERQKLPMDPSVSQRPIAAAVTATVSDRSPSTVVNAAAPPPVLEARTASPEQEVSNTPAEFPRSAGAPSRSQQKPPVLLDTAIMILFVLLFAIICRRIV